MDFKTHIIEWLESQLETSTEEGGNEILPGNVFVDDVNAVSDDELRVWLTNGQRFAITILEL